MKTSSNVAVLKEEINALKKQLDDLLESEQVNSDLVISLSEKLDIIIVEYCRFKNCHQ